jgi:sec-independent protein translocase protein TatA
MLPMSGLELVIILVIFLLFFGAKRVPELGMSLGRGVKELRQGANGEGDEKEANAATRLRTKAGEEKDREEEGARITSAPIEQDL